MFKKKFMNFSCLLFASIIFGMAISVSLARAESSLDSYSDSTQSYTIEKLSSASGQEELAQGDVEEELEEYEIRIEGMTCVNCEVSVKEALLKCGGVKDAWVNHKDGYAVIEANSENIDADEIVGAIEKAGFTVVEEE